MTKYPQKSNVKNELRSKKTSPLGREAEPLKICHKPRKQENGNRAKYIPRNQSEGITTYKCASHSIQHKLDQFVVISYQMTLSTLIWGL